MTSKHKTKKWEALTLLLLFSPYPLPPFPVRSLRSWLIHGSQRRHFSLWIIEMQVWASMRTDKHETDENKIYMLTCIISMSIRIFSAL